MKSHIRITLEYFKAHIPIIGIEDSIAERIRTIEILRKEVAEPLGLETFIWDLSRGLRNVEGKDFKQGELNDILKYLDRETPMGLYIFLNANLDGVGIQAVTNLFSSLREHETRVVFLGEPLPNELAELVPSASVPLPTREEIMEIIRQWIDERKLETLSIEDINLLARAGQGLSHQELEDSLKLAYVRERAITKDSVEHLNRAKIEKLKQYNLTFMPKPDTPVGGLDELKKWLAQRVKLLDPEAKQTKIPAPKGILLVGPPGSGKSMVAKTVSHEWSIPCLFLEMARIFSQGEGNSERNFRNIIRLAESIAPCVLWIDEMEKAFATGNETSRRILGMFLNWMQEKQAPVFVCATINRIAELPPEATRAGRFDGIFFVGLPNQPERVEILNIHLARYGIAFGDTEIWGLTEDLEGYSGAELERGVSEMMIRAYSEDRIGNIEFANLQESLKYIRPLAHTRQEESKDMRVWGRKNARQASSSHEQIAERNGAGSGIN
jgi:ATP-dependent 26S proteasome regulatory subunit